MADELTPNPFSPDPTGGTGGEEVSAEDLDALLSEASALASEISADLGEPTDEAEAEPSEPTESELSSPEPIGLTDGVDTQLQRIEGFVAEASNELGASLELPDERTEPDQAPSPSSEERSIPAFMDDLTRPADEAAPPPAGEVESISADLHEPKLPKTEVKQSVPPEPGITNPPALDDAPGGSEPLVGRSELALEVPPQPVPHETMSADEPADPGKAPKADRIGAIHRATAKLSTAALRLCDYGVQLLEIVDRPVRRLGPGPRHAIGWLAIATLGTSFIVFVVSLV